MKLFILNDIIKKQWTNFIYGLTDNYFNLKFNTIEVIYYTKIYINSWFPHTISSLDFTKFIFVCWVAFAISKTLMSRQSYLLIRIYVSYTNFTVREVVFFLSLSPEHIFMLQNDKTKISLRNESYDL